MTKPKDQPYAVISSTFDAALPWQVVAMFRTFNRGMGRYASREAAVARAGALNRKSQIDMTKHQDVLVQMRAVDVAFTGDHHSRRGGGYKP